MRSNRINQYTFTTPGGLEMDVQALTLETAKKIVAIHQDCSELTWEYTGKCKSTSCAIDPEEMEAWEMDNEREKLKRRKERIHHA